MPSDFGVQKKVGTDMSIHLLSISHKAAPVTIREFFGFSVAEQKDMMERLCQQKIIEECVILATCNRTELYVYSKSKSQDVFRVMKKALLVAAGQEENDEITKYIWRYYGESAIHHLFQVAAGLDSMVIGEDQILGQVKQAHETARNMGRCKTYLNTLFRDCVTGAKKVKTATDLSRASVSTASLAIKAAATQLGGLEHKKVMIIGASGKIGSILLKNLQGIQGIDLYVTTRNRSLSKKIHGDVGYSEVEYDDRYSYIEEMDVIASATASPHYTILYNEIKEYVATRQKVFLDLAVPTDIESKIGTIEGYSYFNMDDFNFVAQSNNEKKKKAAQMAGNILEEYELCYKRWLVFQEALPVMREVEEQFLALAEEKSPQRALQQMFYDIREESTPEELEKFFGGLGRYIKGR